MLSKKISFLIRTDGFVERGLGHVYRCLTLAENLRRYDPLFLMEDQHRLGIDLVNSRGYKIVVHSGNALEFIEKLRPDILINDILNTDADYIRKIRSLGIFVVNFEDLGPGAEYADLVINALYEKKPSHPHIYWGKDYFCLRNEFNYLKPKIINTEVRNILISFGGTDQRNLTALVLRSLINSERTFNINIIVGLGYSDSNMEYLKKIIADSKGRQITVRKNVTDFSKYVFEADLAICAAGRTMYEMMAVGTPCIIIAQNERELSHLQSAARYGLISLGLGEKLSEAKIRKTLEALIANHQIRIRLSAKMRAQNIRSGTSRVLSLIFNGYQKYKQQAEQIKDYAL